ncbi:MAG: MBG domain-containing protein, partial [Lentisphaeria bacterium]
WSSVESSVELVVARATLTVTADDMTRRVGQGNPAFSVTVDGLLGDDSLAGIGLDVVYTCIADEQSAAGDYAITPSGTAETANYAVTYVPGVLKVLPKDIPTITWAAPEQMVYGEALSATQLSATADTPGVFVYDPPLGTQLASGTHTLRVTFTPDDAVNWSSTEASVELEVIAGVAMTLSLTVPGVAEPTVLVFGENTTAAKGLDTWDKVAESEQSACLLLYDDSANAPAALLRDFRSVPADGISRWRLWIGAGGPAVDVSWDIRAASVERGVFLQQIIDEKPVGNMYDLRELEDGVLTVAVNSEWEIVYAAVDEPGYVMRCKSGWNLLGMPMMCTATDAEKMATILEAAGITVWYWENGAYRRHRCGEALHPERGYWLYSAVETELGPLRGVRADGVVLLKPGWNLVSPTSDCELQLPVGASAMTWQGDDRGFTQLRSGMVLREGRGYWVFCSQGEERVQFAIRRPR